MKAINFKSLILFFVLNSLSLNYFAQCINGGCGPQLIPNPGFETLTVNTNTNTPGSQVIDMILTPVQGWYGNDPSGGSTPDYTNLFGTTPTGANVYNTACMTGNGEAGFFTKTSAVNAREYIQAQLTSPLVANHQYCFSLVVKCRQGAAGNLLSACDGIGAWFNNIGIINIQTMNGGSQFLGPGSTINATPQVENPSGNMIGTSCQTITGTFCAQGGESYIVIGNFRSDANTTITGSNPSNYMYVDDISLKESCNIPPSATITASQSSVCAGSCSTLSASVSAGATYTWQPGGQTTPTINACPSVTTTYTLFVSGSGSCLLPQTFSTSTTVSVSPGPSITITPSQTTICSGSSITINATGAGSYTWSPATSLSSANGASVIATPTSNTSYTVVGSNGTCTNSSITNINVSSGLSITVNSASVCSGSSATLTASGATNYIWSPSSSLNSANGASVIATPTSSTTYTIVGASGTCTGTTTTNVAYNITPTLTVNSGSICPGNSISLVVSGATSYSWSNGVATSTIQVSPSSTTSYTVTGNNNGCSSSQTSSVTVLSSPTISVNSSTICSTETATLTANGGMSYTWSPGSSTNSTVFVSPSSNATYTVVGSNGTCTNSATSSVTVLPQVTVIANSVGICAGATATITSSGASSYTWMPMSTNGNTVNVTPSGNVTYTVLGSNGTCSGSTTVNVVVTPLPTITVNNPVICSGTSTQLISSGATSYSWNTGATTSTLNVSPTATTIYTVVGATNGCSSTQTSTVSVDPTPTLTISPDVTIISGTSTTLSTSGSGASYDWSPSTGLSCTSCNSPIASPTITTQYCVSTTLNTCSNSACVTVEVEPPCYSNTDYSTPTAFTPNGDGINDEFCLKGWQDCTTNFQITIYNRWGEKVFETDDVTFCCDGKF